MGSCMPKRSNWNNIKTLFLFLLNRQLCWSLHPWMLFYSLISVLNYCLILALYFCLWSESERYAGAYLLEEFFLFFPFFNLFFFSISPLISICEYYIICIINYFVKNREYRKSDKWGLHFLVKLIHTKFFLLSRALCSQVFYLPAFFLSFLSVCVSIFTCTCTHSLWPSRKYVMAFKDLVNVFTFVVSNHNAPQSYSKVLQKHHIYG